MTDRASVNPIAICKNCKHKTHDVVNTPHGPQQQWFCKNVMCVDPVTGDPVPCNVARQQIIYCGYDGRYFNPIEQVSKAPVIELVSSKSSKKDSASGETDNDAGIV